MGDPVVDSDSDGDALANLEVPPPLPNTPPPCDPEDKPAAEEARCGLPEVGIFRERADDSNCADEDCCEVGPNGENSEEVDEADECRLETWRPARGCVDVKAEFVGEKALREGLWLEVLDLEANPVEIGVRPRRAPC